MTLVERLRQLASALPSDDCAVTITRADLVTLLDDDTCEDEAGSTRDLTVEAVANETGRAPSTVRGWLMAEVCKGSENQVHHGTLRTRPAYRGKRAIP